jgi:protein dithiol oxidoreductase (disulfide-forming)
MNPRRRNLLAALGLTPFYSFAQARRPTPDVDYTELAVPRPVEVPGKIEALEFFWYGCPHCYAFEPMLERWVARLPADVNFRRVPAILNEGWDREAAVFYAFEALGVLKRLHRPFFDAIHRERLDTRDPEVMAAWLKQHNVDPKRYQDAYKSFGVQSKVRRVAQVTRDYRIEGTPELAVNGRYTITVEQGHTPSGMMEVADYLIGVARKGRAASG